MRIAIGIPARFASTRFPGKPLVTLAGRPLIAHVIERALAAELGPVIVATDDLHALSNLIARRTTDREAFRQVDPRTWDPVRVSTPGDGPRRDLVS